MLRRLLAPLCLGLFAAACQTYDFEQVQPLAIAQTTRTRDVAAKSLKPNMMLLVDKSGSMSDGVPGTGRSKIQELQSAMSTFLNQPRVPARVGLTTFPDASSSCAPASTVAEHIDAPRSTEDDAADKVRAAAVLAKVNAITPKGGTPTNFSLQFLGTLPELQDTMRPNFVLLLTDGLPNCNPTIATDCNSPAVCDCGGNATYQTACTAGTGLANGCKIVCLDPTGSIDAIQQLAVKNIKTIVIGFGDVSTAGPALTVLSNMATAGGFPRKCKANADCGASGCNTTSGVCNVPFYEAANGAELTTALNTIGDLIGDGLPPCVWSLDTTAPVNPALIAVIFGDKNIPMGPTTWTYESYKGSADKKVIFQGDYCAQIEASNPQHPVHVEIRAVEQL